MTSSANVRSDSDTIPCGTVPRSITMISSSTPAASKRETVSIAAAGSPMIDVSVELGPCRSAMALASSAAVRGSREKWTGGTTRSREKK